MYMIDAAAYDYKTLNETIRQNTGGCTVTHCLGQRFLAAGMGEDHAVTTYGTPGNALGAYLNGAEIHVHGSAQDAVGDTMNSGRIVIHGSVGDAVGYAMRGGKIFVRGNAGYRAGIHMKAYGETCPAILIGGKCGSFLGEYQAGGILAVLGLPSPDDAPETLSRPIVGNFPSTGMHGGRLYLRGDTSGLHFPEYVSVRAATDEDMRILDPYLTEFCDVFGYEKSLITGEPFTLVTPDTKNPYKQMYVMN
ncbi:MAG: glutamate synthase [Clostridia bacterium]|nr:glutamate synthase [Clostridia bacterium]